MTNKVALIILIITLFITGCSVEKKEVNHPKFDTCDLESIEKDKDTDSTELKELVIDKESKRHINIFLSNFSECFMNSFDINNYSDKQLINFAVSHNYKNNYKLFESTNEEFTLRISKNHIDKTIDKFFDIKKIKHQSVDKEIIYKNDYYKIPIGAGESIPFCQTTKVLDCENGIYLVYANIYIDLDGFVNDPYIPIEFWSEDEKRQVEIRSRVIAKIKNTSSKKFNNLKLIEYNLEND